MSKGDSTTVERIIANTINETARGDPDALAARIVAALGEAGYCIVPEDTALGSQPVDETLEHGGDEPDNMPQAIRATDASGRWATYIPLTLGGKIVVPRREDVGDGFG